MGTKVHLPPSLLYPVEILEVYVSPPQEIKRQQRILKFKYWNSVPDGVSEEGDDVPYVLREFYGYFESTHDGIITRMNVKVKDRINDSNLTICEINEGCDHSVQYGGLCALCGMSLDKQDYLMFNDTDRAPIAMSHDTSGLTVSFQEAERIESKSSRQLLKSRRLILVVDLDQTVIHASINADLLKDKQENNELNDVHRFALKERVVNGQVQVSVVQPAVSLKKQLPSTSALQQPDVRWYYIKLRPHLTEFLEKMHKLYEMHVYTMATKHYAQEVTRAIDPTGKYFADRILSRDTSGSLLHKDLKRLFPVQTNMVTIIDDRGDVWNWSPHLIRCVPYQFWSNTGDINSQFLPKRNGLITPEDLSLNEEDDELVGVGKALSDLHLKFYKEYDEMPAELKTHEDKLPDVGKLLPAMKKNVFDGCVILFSGFFPLTFVDLDSADIVQWVRSFGAIVVQQFLPSVTHVVSRNPGTLKARQAAGMGKTVVQIEWVFKCLEKWRLVDETPFILEVPNPIKESLNSDNEVGTEVDANIANMFVRSLQRGDVNWDAMDEELEELLNSDSEEPKSRKRKREESEIELDLEDDWD